MQSPRQEQTLFALKARWVLPVDRPPLDRGVVTVRGSKVVAVGHRAMDGAVVRDLGDVLILPGFINAHTHLEFSQLANPLGTPGTPIADWIRLVIAERGRKDRESAVSIVAGLSESLRYGITTLGEIATAEASAYVCLKRVPEVHLFHEVIGFSYARIESTLADFNRRLTASDAAIQQTQGEAPCSIRLGVSPHAPYTVHLELLKQLILVAAQRKFPVAMHLAETEEELRLLSDGSGPLRELLEERSMWDVSAIPPQTRPFHYLERLAKAERAMVVHGNYLEDHELAFLGERRDRMSLIYCPRTHAFFQHSPFPLEKSLARGVRVALGTDSRASTPDLSVLREMQTAARSHPNVPMEDILKMGTQWAAEALGIGTEAGTLTPGKRADLIAIPIPNGLGDNPLAALFNTMNSPINVWLGGVEV